MTMFGNVGARKRRRTSTFAEVQSAARRPHRLTDGGAAASILFSPDDVVPARLPTSRLPPRSVSQPPPSASRIDRRELYTGSVASANDAGALPSYSRCL